MTLSSKNYAFVSLGVSCQTAWQLIENKGMFTDYFEKNSHTENIFYEDSCFFDWLICDPTSIARLLMDGFIDGKDFDAEDVKINYSKHNGLLAPMSLKDYSIYFWHAQWINNSEHRANLAEKISYQRQKFFTLNNIHNRIFIISNTQNNLESDVKSLFPEFNYVLDESTVNHIKNSINTLFPDGRNELLIISNDKLITGNVEYYPYIENNNLAIDWRGDTENWRAIFFDILSKVFQ